MILIFLIHNENEMLSSSRNGHVDALQHYVDVKHGLGANMQCDAIRWEQVLRRRRLNSAALIWYPGMKTVF